MQKRCKGFCKKIHDIQQSVGKGQYGDGRTAHNIQKEYSIQMNNEWNIVEKKGLLEVGLSLLQEGAQTLFAICMHTGSGLSFGFLSQ